MEASPEFFQADGDYQNGDPFIIEEFLDIPNDESLVAADGGFEAAMTGSSTDSSTLTAVDNSCNSPFSTAEPHFTHPSAAAGGHFSSELCVPYDGLDDLDWLSSSMVEESFSSEDLQKLQLIQGIKSTRRLETLSEFHNQYQFQPEITRPASMLRPETSIPAKARSKRSRAAPGNWTSRLLVVNSPPPSTAASAAVPTAMSSSSESDISVAAIKKPAVKPASAHRKKDGHENASGEGRRCLHCATDKTPQWRTGPMGPKTLCNACGVRYKSGRLVPEYRPAASPTFVLTKHSNSHRKVLELRRQKEMMRAQQQHQHQQQQFLHHHHHQNMMFDVSNGDDYLIHQHIGPDFRQLI